MPASNNLLIAGSPVSSHFVFGIKVNQIQAELCRRLVRNF